MNVQQRYNQVKSGSLQKEYFLQEALQDIRFKGDITSQNSYEDVIRIFKSKGYIQEEQSSNSSTFDFGKALSNMTEAAKKQKLKGGKGDDLRPEDVNYYEFEKGWRHELEHTDDIDKAKEIALDHLAEDPIYYTRLTMIEKKSDKKRTDLPIEITKDKASLKDKDGQMKPVKAKNMEKVSGKKKALNESFDWGTLIGTIAPILGMGTLALSNELRNKKTNKERVKYLKSLYDKADDSKKRIIDDIIKKLQSKAPQKYKDDHFNMWIDSIEDKQVSEKLEKSDLSKVDKLIKAINILIKNGKDLDGDHLDLILDLKNNLEEPVHVHNIKKTGNKILISYEYPYQKGKKEIETVDLSKESPDQILNTLRSLITAFKKAYKKAGVSLPGSTSSIKEVDSGKEIFSDSNGEKSSSVRDLGYVNGVKMFKITKKQGDKVIGTEKDVVEDETEAIDQAKKWIQEAEAPKQQNIKDLKTKYASPNNPAVISFTFRDPTRNNEVVQYEGHVKDIKKSKTPGAFVLNMTDGADIAVMKDNSGKSAVIYMPKNGKDPIKNPDINEDDAKIFDDILGISKGEPDMNEQMPLLGETRSALKEAIKEVIRKKLSEYANDVPVLPGPEQKLKQLKHEIRNMDWEALKSDNEYQVQNQKERLYTMQKLASESGTEGKALFNSVAPEEYKLKEDNQVHQEIQDWEDMRPEDVAKIVLDQEFHPDSIKRKAAALVLGKAMKDGNTDEAIKKAFLKLTTKSK